MLMRTGRSAMRREASDDVTGPARRPSREGDLAYYRQLAGAYRHVETDELYLPFKAARHLVRRLLERAPSSPIH
jgi:hypothetical protein